MATIGVNLMVWNGQVGAAELALLPQIKAMGYATVELPVFAPNAFDSATVKDALQTQGLTCTISTALPARSAIAQPLEQRKTKRKRCAMNS